MQLSSLKFTAASFSRGYEILCIQVLTTQYLVQMQSKNTVAYKIYALFKNCIQLEHNGDTSLFCVRAYFVSEIIKK